MKVSTHLHVDDQLEFSAKRSAWRQDTAFL